jgi:TolA-binding protein
MSVVDLHPEELLDRYSAGDLTDTETLRLRAHAQTCDACRFEIDARADFAADIARSPISVTPLFAAPREPERVAAPPRAVRRSRKPVWLLAAAITLLAGGSLAAVALRVVPWPAPKTETVPAAALALPEKSAPRAYRASRGGRQEEAAPTSVPFEALPVAPPEAPHEEPARAKIDHTASELFHEATAARTRGDAARAIALYRTLEAGYPRSPEARLSYAMLGRLLLDRGDARSALDGFESYLSQGGAGLALGEEALVGRALALQKLGAQGGEAAAWQEVLRRFPSSVHARLARSRLSALGAG